jgi:hypothetical protein
MKCLVSCPATLVDNVEAYPWTYFSMPSPPKNQHRWKASLDDRTCGVLEKAVPELEWAWRTDGRGRGDSYPLNTDYFFGELKLRLREQSTLQESPKLSLALPVPPRHLADLINEKTVMGVYEEQNEGSYEDALRQAALGFGGGHRAWQKIRRAIDWAYQIDYLGLEATPKPRLQFLHRHLLEVAELVEIDDLKHEGIAEFLDDICPCGVKQHNPDAIRKLRARKERSRPRKRGSNS